MSQTSSTLSISYLKSLWENVDIIHEPHHLNLQATRLKHVLLNGQEGGVRLLGSLKGHQREILKKIILTAIGYRETRGDVRMFADFFSSTRLNLTHSMENNLSMRASFLKIMDNFILALYPF
jgi:hypothetical protein